MDSNRTINILRLLAMIATRRRLSNVYKPNEPLTVVGCVSFTCTILPGDMFVCSYDESK
eukprot:CAMPEP_0119031812 /NCGR_PEP_ID=MMETSP1176-20130426/41733_1 /TAXON_ID=265551 /ORGANISM="Synedropsis recta cf, Strain CCMP1620" /LENGTH=58 /DNA_ID=CAMNT_0006988215 /DNA_START=232 /DNA_END=408 /DNA_ORIENTATION=-